MGRTQIIQPEVTVSIVNADAEVGNDPQRVLLVGQMLTGSATAGELVENISSSGAPEDALFGEASQLAAMVRAFKKLNQVVRIDAIPLDDAGGGTAQEFTITIVGTATEAGTLHVVAGSETDHSYDVAVSSGDTATTIAAAIVTAVTADTKCPFTAANVAGVVTLTARNAGTVAGFLPVGTSGVIAGITGQAVASSVAGATDPSTTSILDVATSRYHGIVWPYPGAVADLKAFLDPRFNATNDVLDGVGFIPLQDTLANSLSTLNGQNSQSVVYIVAKAESETNYIGPDMEEPGYVKATMVAAIRSLRL